MSKILYLEDEHFLGRIVKESLESRGFEMHLIADGKLFMDAFNSYQPDLCVLDVMVPNVDGFTLGKEVRAISPQMPIIFLTAKNQTDDVLEGFKSGGNDYIKKPFSMEELIVRINNLLQLNSQQKIEKSSKVQIGSYAFDYSQHKLLYNDHIISLSHRENELIRLLSNNINSKIDRRVILNTIWGDDSLYNSRNLDVYIRKLRVYFEKDDSIQLITLRGFGYHFSVGS